MTGTSYESWGRYPRASQEACELRHRVVSLSGVRRDRSWLPYGNGRSYGDVCLNDGGLLLHTRGLDRFSSFDPATGVIACESGVLLSEILDLVVPQRWFPCVTPGTRFVTVGGAIANDVHGKNHHVRGTFGRHVLRFELLRSDGSRCICSRDVNSDLFRATIGGLGLTGLIQWAEFQLRPIASTLLRSETIKFASLDEFFSLSSESDRQYEYTVAWIDCVSSAAGKRGRGHFIRAVHASGEEYPDAAPPRTLSFPFDPPFSLINRNSLRGFNALYYHRQPARARERLVHYRSFFYPLDGIARWNRIYGKRGFLQFQCVVPDDTARDALNEMLSEIAASGQGSFLAVLKRFGDVASPGMLSFPRPGPTLALDFPNDGTSTLELLARLERITLDARGALYPAKDARMSGAAFRASFSSLDEFSTHVDPQFSSSFWRRVNA